MIDSLFVNVYNPITYMEEVKKRKTEKFIEGKTDLPIDFGRKGGHDKEDKFLYTDGNLNVEKNSNAPEGCRSVRVWVNM